MARVWPGNGSRSARTWRAAVVAAGLGLIGGLAVPGAREAHAAGQERVFTIGNYPVEARAANAVAAKDRAIADGQQAALRTLLKRLVPVTLYRRLGNLKATPAAGMIESFAVRSERNSSTDYIASYDFVFAAEPIRRLLEAEGIPYLDRQAAPITIVPVYRVPPEMAAKLPRGFSEADGAATWLNAWRSLDLGNSLTPARLEPLRRELHADTVKGLAEGDPAMVRVLQGEYRTETVVAAILEPDGDLKRINVVLAGRDAVQNLYLKRYYRLEGLDLAYTAELSAVISLAILEGRWKAINVKTTPAAAPGVSSSGWASGATTGDQGWQQATGAPGGGSLGPMTISVVFHGMGEWQDISRKLTQTPEVSGIDVLGLSARGARVSLTYPGGAERLAVALAGQGLILESAGSGWRLSRR